VVVTILAVLATITVLQYAGINKRARDSARRSDIYEISTALEVNKTQQGYQPLAIDQFSSFQWIGPVGDVYCIVPGLPTDPLLEASWEGVCPGGFEPVAPGAPSGFFATWKVCTFLENPNPGQPHVFCKTSSQ